MITFIAHSCVSVALCLHKYVNIYSVPILNFLKCNCAPHLFMQRVYLKKEKKNLTFSLLEGVRHDGICSGNQVPA